MGRRAPGPQKGVEAVKDVAAHGYQAFRREVRSARWADPLRKVALAGRLGERTRHLTE